MKKIFSLLLVGVLSLTMSVGCSSSSQETQAEPAKPVAEKPAEEKVETEKPVEEKPTYEPATVRVAYMANMGSASAVVAGIKQGFFEEFGLNVELVQFGGGPAEIAAMASGDIDIAQIGHGAHALCIEGEAEIFAMDALSLSDAVIANTEKGIQSIEDLKGKKVAVQAGTSSEIILNLALERVGMSQSDIEIIQMEASGMVSAMISGGIDACATWEPSSTTIRAQMGDKALTLASNADFLEEATFPSSFITTEKYADTNRDILVRFAMGLLKAQDYRNSNIEEVCKTVAKQIEADEATILETKSGAKWLTGEEIKGYVADGTIKTYYESQQQVFIKDGRITDVVPVEEYVMFDIFEEAVANYK